MLQYESMYVQSIIAELELNVALFKVRGYTESVFHEMSYEMF